MSKEPGACDSYVKVYDAWRWGCDGWGGGSEGPHHWTEFQGLSTYVGLGLFEVAATVTCLVSSHS